MKNKKNIVGFSEYLQEKMQEKLEEKRKNKSFRVQVSNATSRK